MKQRLINFITWLKTLQLQPGSLNNKKTINNFHKLFYDSATECGKTWRNTKWLGHIVWKSPFDLWVYQEMIFDIKPDVIIETGTAYGGSAVYFANLLDILGKGKVISIDIASKSTPFHKRIAYINGSSTSISIMKKIKKMIGKQDKVMVVLDSNHAYSHVLEELEIYSKLVSKNSYLVVEDSNLNGNPVVKKHGPGPYEAIVEFMKGNKKFIIDRTKEKYLFTFNPSGYLKRV